MSPAVCHLLILWMTLVSYPRMSATSSPYVSGFDYVPRFHPSRNPDCPSRFVRDRQLNEDYDVWDRPSIEIRALLSGCSRSEEERTTREEFHIRRKRRYNEEEDPGRITNCTRKILISMRFNNIGKTDIQEKFVVIDHALDSLTMKKIPLRNPYVIKVRQEPILQMYGLKFQSVVNAEAKEEVINNRNPNYKGCYTDSDRPTCGQSFVRGEPVPFSQGFCCSCDSRVNGEQQYGGWNESSSGEAKSNNKDATNNFGNRLRTGNASSDDNSMAPRQPEGKEIESKKKSNVSHVNLTYDQTIKTNVSIYNTFRDEDRHRKLSNEVPLEDTYLNKKKTKQEKSQETSKSVPSSLLKMNLINVEKYSKKQPDRSSTSRSSLSAEVTAGRMPSGDKITSDDDVGQDRACGLGNEVSPRKTGCLVVVHRTPSPINELNSKNTGSETNNQICDGEVYKNRCEIEENRRTGSDRGFHTIDTKADVKKVSGVSEKDVAARSKNQLSRFEDPFRSMKHERERKLTSDRRRKKVGKGNDENGARRNVYEERWPESFHGDKGPSVKSSKKRNKVFLAPVTIDSPAIRPSMHLNEPLKNSSTGVSNGNRSPAGRRWSNGGNLNGVMENTSESGEIIGGTFNEKHRRDGPLRGYVQSNGNEEGKRSRAATLNEKKKRGFQRAVSRKSDLSANKEMRKNYTPQKRTLKDVSYRNDEQRGSGKRRKRHGVACHSRKKNFVRSRRHLRRKKNSLSRRRTRRLNEKHGRGRRKRSKKYTEDDKGSPIRNPGHDVQVYIDNTKTLEERMSEKSRLRKLAHDEKAEMGRNGRRSNGMKDDSISRKEGNRQDSVDKQIEEKFSRISDALKEDAMGSKTIMEEKQPDTADVDPVNNEREESSNDVAEVENKLEELDTASSYRKGEENRKANGNEVPGAIKINENIDDAVENPRSYQADILDVNQGAYGNTQGGRKYEQAFANSQQNDPSNLNELIDDYKTSTSNYDLAISPTIGSSASNEKNQLTSNVFTPVNVDEIQLYGMNNPDNVPVNPVPSTTETNGQLTRAVIVVDFFKIPTDSLTTFRDIPEPAVGTQPKLMDRLGGLKKNIEKALMKLKPVSRNTAITESTTMMLTEPTIKNTSLETTTSIGTTKITEPGFRVSSKPTESGTQISPGGAEMHHEVIIDGLTFPDETTKSLPPTRSFLSLNSISGKLGTSKVKRKSRIGDRRRKKRRTTPSSIKNDGLEHRYERREDRNMHREGVPRDYEAKKRSTQPDSPIKFSLEARNVDVVKQRIGEGCSFSREQRNYLQVRVDDHGEAESNTGDKFAPRKYERFRLNEAKVRNENKDASSNVEKVRNSIADLKLLHRPWFVTTAVSKYTIEPNSPSNHALLSKSTTNVGESRKMKNEAIYGENSSSSTTGGVQGRILPPCTSDKHRSIENRGRKSVICEAETNPGGRRRLLSVQRLKDGKNVEKRSSKDRKKILEDEEEEEEDNNFVKDDGTDVEYEEDTSKHRKRLKPVRDKDQEKSKKRNVARLKRKKEKKEKKQLISSSDNLSGDYDYYIPGEQVEEDDRTILEQGGQAGGNENNNPDEMPLEYYEADPILGGLAGKEVNEGAKIAMDTQETNLNDQMIDNTDPANDFDKFTSDVKSGNGDIQDGTDELAGKDFEISLTGKIHLESDSYGRPVSISFNAAPEFPRKDTIDDGKANGNRFPSESANSFIAASDTLVPAGTDNTNFLPNVFDVEPPPPSMNVPLDPVDDRSIAREYFLDTIRSRSKYRNPRLMPLHLQKKSVDSAKDQATSSKQLSSKSFKRSLKRTKKDSGSSKSALDTNFGMEDAGQPKEDDNSNIGDTNEDPLSSNQEDSKETSDENVGDLPQLSLDMPNLPETSLLADDFGNKDSYTKIGDDSRDSNSGSCFALNTTTQKIILPDTTTTTMTDTYLGAVAETTVLSFHDFAVAEDSNSTEVETAPPTTTTVSKTTTVSTVETTTTTSSNNETVVEAKLSYPKPEAAMGITRNLTEFNPIENLGNYTGENSKESIEKKNMLAVSEFVKKLEKLVADGNSTNNTTGRTLIHLKKFIIVPDNRTLWSLKKYVKPEDIQDTGSTETIIVMGEGTHDKDAKQPLENDRDLEDQEYLEVEDEEKSRADPNLIKQIISSVIRGEDLKRNADPPKSFDAPSDLKMSEFKDWANQEVGKNTKDLAKETSTKGEGCLQSVEKNVGEPILETSLENEKKSSKKDNDVCTDCKSNAKAKREATVVNARSVDGKRQRKDHGKKEVKHPKKKRRKKRKRKIKKRKGGGGKRRTSKKAKSKWPFKRNLLMLSEEDQIQPSNVEDGTKLRSSRDQSSMRKNRRKKMRSARMANEENRPREPQIRGGQDCSDHRHPADVDPFKYLESAHCLRFSDLWYSVYRLEEPVVVHKVHLQIYVKQTSPDGSTTWKDLTNGSTIRLGTFDKHYRNKERTMSLTYTDVKVTSRTRYSLDPGNDRLLIPSSTLPGKRSKYSEAEGWSSEYLVVQADKINEDASNCDKAGVGFTAFVNQPDRCERVSGTCLRNQPMDYWRHDVEARKSGRAGCYFLSNFARVPSEAIKYNVNGNGSREFLALEYHSPHVSVIDVELADDYNALLRAGSSGRLTEVHVDNTAIDYTVITVLITNKGSSSSSYRARITDCPKGLPASWLNAESATKTISPHRDRKVALDLYGRLSLNEFSCSVVLLNRYGEPIARREIKVQKMDRCVCMRHCVCSCMSNLHDDTTCRPMLLEHYHAAGFRGPLPVPPTRPSIWSSILTIVCLVLTILLLLLLLLGFFKWLIGICVPAVSRWGLDDLVESDKMTEYYEKNLKSKSVVFDQFGQPVHPETGGRSIRVCSRKLEFFLNLTFFFLHPFVICCLCFKKPRRPGTSSSSVVSKASLMSEKGECPAMICVSTYGDAINSKMEAEDTKYVIDELKKSQESLQNHSRYKRKEILQEHSSSD